MRIAFKEWAVIVDALARGEQIIVLRKGGLREGPGGFQVEHPAFLLFPTLFHQQQESVIASAQARYEVIAAAFPAPSVLRLEYHAEVVDWRRIGSLETAGRLRGQHIWKEEVVAQRYAWGKEQNILALALRVYRLPQPVDLPLIPAYSGCKSWVELEQDLPTHGSQAVLTDAQFTEKLRAFREVLD